MTQLSTSLFDNLYKDFIGAQNLIDRLDLFYDKPRDQFPPYNITEYENGTYVIEIALAGFNKSEITIDYENGTLVVRGKKETKTTPEQKKFIWTGIAQRQFIRRFLLEDNIKVAGAEMTDGILRIDLQKIVPEKPKSTLIAIK